jgi:hypothetical protein
MKKYFLVMAFFLGVFSVNSYGQNRIEIFSENKNSVNYYNISEFYFVHQIFADAFYMTSLHKQLNYNEMSFILKTVLYKLDKDNKVNVVIKNSDYPGATLVFFIKEETENGILLGMLTTYNTKKGKFTKKLHEENSLARWYYIKGDKLVYRKDLYSKELEKEREDESKHQLVNFYLFDDNQENDNKIKPLIDNILSDTSSSKIDILYAKLYLGEYHLLNNDLENAIKSLEELKKFYNENENKGITPNYLFIVNLAETEIEMMKRMKEQLPLV